MGDHHNPRNQSSSGSQDFHTILGIAKGASIRDVCKAYKSLVMRWHPDKNPNKIEAEAKFKTINEAYEALKDKQQEDKKSNGVYECFSDNEGGSRPTTPKTPFRHRSVDSYSASSPTFLPKSASRRSNTPTRATPSLGSLPKSTSQRSASPGSLPKSTSQRSASPSSLPKSTSQRSTPSPGSLPKSTSQRSASPGSLPKSTSQRSTNPIMFSYSTARRKLPPVEKTLECTLDELSHGCVKKIKVTRDVLTDTGIIVQEEELLRIKVKPGWKKGTKITFEGMGDEKPGTYPADIIFCIDEKRHPLFKREGDDLVLAIEIPLVKALTGCSFSVPLLGGEKMSLSFDDIIYPGYEKIIRGQGMPIAKDQVGKRGDLRIKFRIIFPKQLNDEQRSDILSILNES